MKIEIELNEEEVTEAVEEYLEKRGYDVGEIKINVGHEVGRRAASRAVFKNVKASVQDNRHSNHTNIRL